MRRPTALIALALSGALLAAVPHAETQPPSLSPLPAGAYLDPHLRELMESVTFRVTFDGNSVTPDMAAGEDYAPTIRKSWNKEHDSLVFADGRIGRALVLGTGSAWYASAAGAPLATRGAVAFWVKPEQWRHDEGGNVTFFGNTNFLIERQGPTLGTPNRKGRQESVLALGRAESKDRFTSINGGVMENGRWHFIAVNWSWPQMAMSVDGGPFKAKSLRGRPAAEAMSGFYVGSGGGRRALLDEVLIFSRPLTPAEVKRLHAIPGDDVQDR